MRYGSAVGSDCQADSARARNRRSVHLSTARLAATPYLIRRASEIGSDCQTALAVRKTGKRRSLAKTQRRKDAKEMQKYKTPAEARRRRGKTPQVVREKTFSHKEHKEQRYPLDVCVPEGLLRIARRFNAGSHATRRRVPKGRLNETTLVIKERRTMIARQSNSVAQEGQPQRAQRSQRAAEPIAHGGSSSRETLRRLSRYRLRLRARVEKANRATRVRQETPINFVDEVSQGTGTTPQPTPSRLSITITITITITSTSTSTSTMRN